MQGPPLLPQDLEQRHGTVATDVHPQAGNVVCMLVLWGPRVL